MRYRLYVDFKIETSSKAKTFHDTSRTIVTCDFSQLESSMPQKHNDEVDDTRSIDI